MSVELEQDRSATNQQRTRNEGDATLVARLWRDLDGQVPREQINRVVAEIAVTFEDAAVQVFVPILIHRQALDRLKAQIKDQRQPATGAA